MEVELPRRARAAGEEPEAGAGPKRTKRVDPLRERRLLWVSALLGSPCWKKGRSSARGMLTGMEFFLPVTAEDEYEQRYVELARFAGASVPVPGARLWAVQWESDGEVWEATVGELLVRVTPLPRVQDGAAVMAIFPGDPYLIVTSAQPLTSLRSGWHNPISAGVPPQVRKTVPFDIP
jgi:hypothetical protein